MVKAATKANRSCNDDGANDQNAHKSIPPFELPGDKVSSFQAGMVTFGSRQPKKGRAHAKRNPASGARNTGLELGVLGLTE